MHCLPRHRFLTLWLLLTGMLGALPALAAAEEEQPRVRWYQIELIAFSNNRTEAVGEELWPRPQEPTAFAPAVNLLLPEDAERAERVPSSTQEDTASEAPLAFGLLRHEELELLPQAYRMARSPHYNLLLHIGWRQPVVQNLDPPLAVFIDDTLQAPGHPQQRPGTGAIGFEALSPRALLRQALLQEEIAATATPNLDQDVLSSIPVIEYGPPQSILFGTVSLRWNRFLHLALNLVYRSQREEKHLAKQQLADIFPLLETSVTAEQTGHDNASASTRPAAQPAGQFQLRESRRIRTNTLYYFDHPLFGVLVRVKPVELPQPSQP